MLTSAPFSAAQVSDRKNYSVDNCPKYVLRSLRFICGFVAHPCPLHRCKSEDIRFRAKTKEVICDNEACKERTIVRTSAYIFFC